ncbi:MAG: glycosyl hydrolase 108 family protein [Oceanicaulis sp.]
MADFDRAMEAVVKWEGGFVNHPDDPGGATNLGITRNTLSGWRGRPVSVEEVRDLTYEEAKAIYRTLYWDVCRCGEMEWPAALMVFDASVNHGVRQAARFLQRAVGVTADGIIGPITLGAVQAVDAKTVAEAVAARRMAFYGELATFGVFGFGWARRLMNILRLSLEPAPPSDKPAPPPEDGEDGDAPPAADTGTSESKPDTEAPADPDAPDTPADAPAEEPTS